MNKNLKIISGLIVIFVVIFSIISVYSAYYGPVDAQTYESQIDPINNKFQEILELDRQNMGTSNEMPLSTVQTQLKSLIDQMGSIQKRGYPSQYETFHDYLTVSMNEYLQWRSYGRYTNSSYANFDKGSRDLGIAYDSFNNVSVTYKITSS